MDTLFISCNINAPSAKDSDMAKLNKKHSLCRYDQLTRFPEV
jgi:hypothetical protein